MTLRDALHEFRRDATVKKFSRAVLKNSGPGVVMSNEILQRIVDCAHFHKIESREQLERETRWAGAGEFGDEIVDLIGKHRPKPPPTADEFNEGDASSSSRVVKSRKCSKCGALDHICRFYPYSIHLLLTRLGSFKPKMSAPSTEPNAQLVLRCHCSGRKYCTPPRIRCTFIS